MVDIQGPIPGGRKGWPFAASILDVADYGYIEEEYFLSGEANRFRLVSGTELSPDGKWNARAAGKSHYKTRVLVYRPADPARFNGTVVMTWNNVTAGYDLFGSDSLEIFEGGFVLVGVTTQKAGIEGLPPVRQGLADWDPDRYGSLHIASDDYSYDLFTNAGTAFGPERDRAQVDPMGGLEVKRLIAQGASQSASRLGTYINAIAPLGSPFDGYILTIYFGRGAPIEVGGEVININLPQESSSMAQRLRGVNRLRDDLARPIFVVNSELEAIACYDVRQEDSDTFRYWEAAGTCHVSQQARIARKKMSDRDQLVTRPLDEGINAIPMMPMYDAAFYHMHHWIAEGIAPPLMPRINFVGEPPEVVRDENGIATGGVRLPQADVPLAANSAIPRSADLFDVLMGSMEPFEPSVIEGMYPDRESFLGRFEAVAKRSVETGAILGRDLPKLLAEAAEAWDALVASGAK